MTTALQENVFRSLVRHRELVWQMTVRDLKAVVQGSVLGRLWLVISPLIQLVTYVAVVSFVLQGRITGGGIFDYALYVLAGMVPWQIMSRALQEAPGLIRDRMDLVKQVIYPIESLPVIGLVVASFASLVSLALYVILSIAVGKAPWSLFLLPLPLALLGGFLLGAGWIMSIAGVVLKDLREMVAMLMGLLVYASPVVLSRELVGERIWAILMLNPLAHVVICFRDVLQAELHAASWLVFILMTTSTLLLGGALIGRAKVLINEYL